MDDIQKMRLEQIIGTLPSAETHKEDVYFYGTYTYDSKSSERPQYATLINLVFVKNKEGNNWVFDGVNFPEEAPKVEL